MDDLVAKALHAARQHFDEGGFLESLRGMFSGPDYLSNSKEASFANMDPNSESAADNATLENFRSGVELTLKQLNSVFEKFRIVEINPVGQKFDPHQHQAINAVESDAEPNTVVQVFQKGYLLNDRIVRPAMVSVAKAKG